MHSTYLPWLLEQIRECLAIIDEDPARHLGYALRMAQLYADWSTNDAEL